MVGIDDLVAKTFWRKFSVKRPDNFTSHWEAISAQNLKRVDSNEKFGVLDQSQVWSGVIAKAKKPDRNH